MDSAGFNNLDNKFDIIYKDINSSILITGLSVKPDESFIDKVINENKVNYKVNIMHYPDEFDNIKKYNYDLVLAGHSHNGQIALPVYGAVITPENAKEYYKPYYKIDNTSFYISSGVGTTKFDYRFLNKPSFNLYRILKNRNKSYFFSSSIHLSNVLAFGPNIIFNWLSISTIPFAPIF